MSPRPANTALPGSAAPLDTVPGSERRRPHPAPVARRVLMVLIVLGVLGAFSVLVWLAVQIRTLTDNSHTPNADDLRRATELFRTLVRILSASVVGVAIWIGHFGWRIRRSEVYPPPGSRHLRVRRVLRGAAAKRMANVFIGVGFVLLLCGLAEVPLVMRLLASLGFQSGG
ncbi:MAG TPA: hypothetical protein VH542_02510 [Steroidobacteraceae bacterium]|jgi:hypothetical protein